MLHCIIFLKKKKKNLSVGKKEKLNYYSVSNLPWFGVSSLTSLELCSVSLSVVLINALFKLVLHIKQKPPWLEEKEMRNKRTPVFHTEPKHREVHQASWAKKAKRHKVLRNPFCPFTSSWPHESSHLCLFTRLTFSESPGIRHKQWSPIQSTGIHPGGRTGWLTDLTWSRIYAWSTHQRSGEQCQRKHGPWDLFREKHFQRQRAYGLHGDQNHVVGAMLRHEISLQNRMPGSFGVWVLPIATVPLGTVLEWGEPSCFSSQLHPS